MNEKNTCKDKLINGNCTLGKDCLACNSNENEKEMFANLNLNTDAKVFVPKSKRVEDTSNAKLNLNLGAAEYIPKIQCNENVEVNDNVEPEDELNDEDYEGEEFDMIMKDIINNEALEELEEEESDDEKWFPRFKDCECCKGFIYKCNGTACLNMGTCYCKMKEECDDEEN
jgi:hypothetical protein